MHMGDLLRQVAEHPEAEIAGIFDPDRSRMDAAIATFGIPEDRVFTDLEACLTRTQAELAIVCSATAEHAEHRGAASRPLGSTCLSRSRSRRAPATRGG